MARLFTPTELIEKLVALIPPPQANLLRYHGVLAPGSKLRSRVVADRRRNANAETPTGGGHAIAGGQLPKRGISGVLEPMSSMRAGESYEPKTNTRRRMTWRELLKRVFAVDVLECPRCRGPMKIIAEITDPKAIRRFLAALDLPTEAPRIERARPPPQVDFGWDDELHAEPTTDADMVL
ncbi:MAG: transposase, partial [Nannocystaceae bacterium]